MTIYRFARCELDTDRHQLLVAGIKRHIEPQVFDLLLMLAENGDAVVSQDELIERVWRGRVVSDSAISVRINAARKVVGDNGSRQAVIRTVPRRGFQLAVEVERVDPEPEPDAIPANPGAEGPGKPVLGVFPFESLSSELNAYLVRGIAEDIATELSRFSELIVIAPYSTFRHDFDKQDQFEIARSLGITHIISGSLAGKTTAEQLTVRLIDARDGSIIWSDRYSVGGDDFFDARQDAIARIVSSLSQGLNTRMLLQARGKSPRNLSSYECLLRGLHLYKWGVSNMEEAEQARFWFDRAIELDPDYGRPRAWRECVGSYWWSSPPTPADLGDSMSRIDEALLLDETDHEIHRIKGALLMCCGEHDLGGYHLAKAVELNPNDANILLKIGMYRSFLAENFDDLTYIDMAFERNPLHPAWYWQDRAIALFSNARYEETVSNLQRNPGETEVAHMYYAAAYVQLDEMERAREHATKLREMNPEAGIDWLQIAYPTRCYQSSEHASRFREGLEKAGLT